MTQRLTVKVKWNREAKGNWARMRDVIAAAMEGGWIIAKIDQLADQEHSHRIVFEKGFTRWPD